MKKKKKHLQKLTWTELMCFQYDSQTHLEYLMTFAAYFVDISSILLFLKIYIITHQDCLQALKTLSLHDTSAQIT